MNRLYINKDWSSLKKLLFLNAASGGATSKTETLSGSIVTFSTTKAVPLIDCKADINPVQTGSGDPSPENVRPITGWTGAKVTRTGKNLLFTNCKTMTSNGVTFTPIGNGSSFIVDGTATTNIGLTLNTGAIAPQKLYKGQTYTLSGGHWSNTGVAYVQLVYKGDETGSIISIVSVNDTSTRTLTENASLQGVFIIFVAGNTFTNDLVEPQFEISSTATTFEPYTGQTVDVQFPAMGKNLLPIGSVTLPSENYWLNYNPDTPLPAGTYTLSVTVSVTGGMTFNVRDKDGNTQNSKSFAVTANQQTAVTVTASKPIYNVGGYYNKAGTVSDIQLEPGSTATSYEPFTNTVYGGTLDVITGELVVDRRIVTANEINSSENSKISPADTSHGIWVYRVDNAEETLAGITNEKLLCNILPTSYQNYLYNASNGGRIGCAIWWSKQLGIATNDITVNDISLFKQWCVDNNIVLIYPLATPLVYHLTPQEITALSGDNTIWADTGDITVTFRK